MRKAQFFIITVVLVAGSLSLTINVLEDYSNLDYQEVTGSRAISQFNMVEETVSDTWYTETWEYRRQIKVTENSDHELNEVPIAVEVDTETLIDDGKLQDDCDDLRVKQDGRTVPVQFKQSQCDETDTTVWMMVDLEAGETTSDLYLYYGNDRISEPEYDTSLEYDSENDVIENGMLRLDIGNYSDEWGVKDLRRSRGPNLAEEGLLMAKHTASGQGYTIEHEGPVFINVSFDDRWYLVFQNSPFMRTRMDFDGAAPYGNTSEVLDTWYAGREGGDDDFDISSSSGGTGDLTTNIVGAEREEQSGVLAMLPLNGGGMDMDYDFSKSSGELAMGFTGGPSDQWVDYWVGNVYPSIATIDQRLRSPTIELSDTERKGSFAAGLGWSQKRVIELTERAGRILVDFPVNVTFNTGRMDIRHDCSNLVFVENGRMRPYNITDQCDSRSFREPDDFAARIPMDEGRGDRLNDSTDTYQGSVAKEDGSDPSGADYEWIAAQYGLGVFLKENRNPDEDVFISFDKTGIQLGESSFTISFWFNMNRSLSEQPNFLETGGDSDENHELYLFDYADVSPALRIWNASDGRYLLQGRYRNSSGTQFNVTVDDPTTRSLQTGWHQVTLLYNKSATNLSLYLDGRLASFNDSMDTSMGVTPTDYTIGRGLEGSYDEFKVYTRPLTDDEILDMYQDQSTISVRTDLNVRQTESDLAVYAGSPSAIDNEERWLDLSPGERDIDREPEASVSEIKRYDELIERLAARVSSGRLSERIDLNVIGRCSGVDFETARFALQKVVC